MAKIGTTCEQAFDLFSLPENEIEEWKDIPGYEGFYQASTLGRIKSYGHLRPNPITKTDSFFNGRIRIPRIGRDGYLYVVLAKEVKHITKKIHQLTSLTFIPNPENKPQVNHINGDKTDNRAVNLEWNTRSENIRHADRLGLRKMPKGDNCTNSKLTQIQVLEIRAKYSNGVNIFLLAKEYRVSRSCISDIIRRRNWKHI